MRVIKFVVVGALVLSVWSGISWMLPWHDPLTYKSLPAGKEFAGILENLDLPGGVYAYPGPPSGSSMEETINAHREGPVFVVHFRPSGVDPMSPLKFVGGLLANLTVLIVAIVGGVVPVDNRSHRRRRLLRRLAAIGLVVAIGAYAPLVIWQHTPFLYALVMGTDIVIGWLLIGAAFIPIAARSATGQGERT